MIKKIRPNHILFIEMVVLIIGFVAIVLGPSLVGQRIFVPDVHYQAEPYRSLEGVSFKTSRLMVSDIVDSLLPKRKIFFENIKNGHFVGWDNLSAGGATLGTTFEIGAFGPLSLPFYLLPFWLANAYSRLLAIVGSAFFAYLFLRRLRLGKSAAIIGGLVYMSSGFMIAWNNWPQDQTAAWIPALFWATERYFAKKSWSALALIAAVTGAMLLEGFPAVTGYALYAIAVYVVVRLSFTYKKRISSIFWWGLKIMLSLVAGIGLSAFQVLPFYHRMQALDLSMRGGLGHLDLASMTTMFAPFALGNITQSVWYGKFNYIETISFVGAAALIFVLMGLSIKNSKLKSGVQGFFVGAAIITTILIFHGGFLLRLVSHLPVFSNNFIGRARSILGFVFAVLAAIGFDLLFTKSRIYKIRDKIWSLIILLAVLALGGLIFYRVWTIAQSAGHARFLLSSLLFPTLSFVTTALIVFVVYRKGIQRARWLLALVPILVVMESIIVVAQLWPSIPKKMFFPSTPTHIFLQENIGEYRYAANDYTMFLSAGEYYNLRSVNGHVFAHKNWTQLLQGIDSEYRGTPTIVFLSSKYKVVSSSILNRLAVKYFVNAESAPLYGKWQKFATGNEVLELRGGQSIVADSSPGPIRGIKLKLAHAYEDPGAFDYLSVRIKDVNNKVIASGKKRIYKSLAKDVQIPIAGESIPNNEKVKISVTFESDSSHSIKLNANTDNIIAGVLLPVDDGLKLVYAGGDTVIWQRLNVLPRIRWAKNITVEPDPIKRIHLLASSSLDKNTVVLEEKVEPISGQPAHTLVVKDGDQNINVKVNANGAGYLVVADALQDGWSVKIDNKKAVLENVDHALVAVRVPAGTHNVEFAYDAPGFHEGIVVSLGSGLFIILVIIFARYRKGRKKQEIDTPVLVEHN